MLEGRAHLEQALLLDEMLETRGVTRRDSRPHGSSLRDELLILLTRNTLMHIIIDSLLLHATLLDLLRCRSDLNRLMLRLILVDLLSLCARSIGNSMDVLVLLTVSKSNSHHLLLLLVCRA